MARRPRSPRIFLSYSHKDSDFGVRLVKYLRQVIGREEAVWFDNKLSGGAIWWETIMKELSNCNMFLVLLSPDALKSRYVRKEIHVAFNKNKYIIPILRRECKIPADMSYLDTWQRISFLPGTDYEVSFKKLLEAVGLPSTIDVGRFARELKESDASHIQSHQNEQIDILETSRTHIREIIQMVESAFERQDWCEVIAITKVLTNLYPGNIPASVYEKQGLAYLYTEKECDERYMQAQDALRHALACVRDSQWRLNLLDAYAFALIQQNLWEELPDCINQALSLSPDAATKKVWEILQAEMPFIEPADHDEPLPTTHGSNRMSRIKDIILAMLLASFVASFLHRLLKRHSALP